MTYTVIVAREGDNWLADVPEVTGAHTFARSLSGLKKSVREVIALMDDLDDDARIDMHLDYRVDDTLVSRAAIAGHERQALAKREQDLRLATIESVGNLTAAGYSVRDTAALLEVTPGRVSQLANA